MIYTVSGSKDTTQSAGGTTTTPIQGDKPVPVAPAVAQPEKPLLGVSPAAPVPWRHVTSLGNRWSLRPSGDAMVLFIDLGNDQVANVNVAPEFVKLDLAAMNVRVDWLRSQIVQRWSSQTGSYVYRRDATITQVQP